ncbi:MAG: Cell surface protein [Verrucomicrobiales bacterium]|nr:Cell surface protein [Verrucomicrobiales bacterium]
MSINIKIILCLTISVVGLSIPTHAQFIYHTNLTSGYQPVSISIAGYTGTNPVVLIPEVANGLPVTAIADSAFAHNVIVSSVTTSTNITSLLPHTFENCTSLTNFDIPAVTNIDAFAFAGCSKLSSVTIASNITVLGQGAFQFCSGITNLLMAEGVLNLGGAAFFGCNGLTSVTVPNSVAQIGAQAFNGCANLNAILVDPGNANYTSLTGVLFNKDQTVLIEYPGGKIGNYNMPDTVVSTAVTSFYGHTRLTGVTFSTNLTSIGMYSFDSCAGLTNVVLPPSLTSIGALAFANCTGLPSITIPAAVTAIENSAFSNCAGLTNFSIDAGNPFYSSLDGVLFDKLQTRLIQYPPGKSGDYAIPNTVTTIGNSAFWYCTFSNISISESVNSIEQFAFTGCTHLLHLRIPNSVTSIGQYAFDDCEGLDTITIGTGLTNLQYNAFYYCLNLTGVYFESNPPTLGPPVFQLGNGTTAFYLPGTSGWGPTFGGCPTAIWNPQAIIGNGTLGSAADGFSFTIIGASNLVTVVETCTNLTTAVWSRLQTNKLFNGTALFSDSDSTNHPTRFYRFALP